MRTPRALLLCAAAVVVAATGGALLATTPAVAAPAWSTQVAPAPTKPDGALDTVSCAGPTACIAAGTHVVPDGAELPGAVRLTAHGWVATAMPVPAGVTSTRAYGLSCAGTARCLAVYTVFRSARWHWLVETWNGRSWRAGTSVPFGRPRGIQSVTCADVNRCLVVLDAHHAQLRTAKGWTGVRVPAAAGTASVVGGACGATDDCQLVEVAHDNRLVSLHWDGAHFGTPRVTAVRVKGSLRVSRVSCVTPSGCAVTGTQEQSKPHPFVAHWNGRSWVRVAVPASFTGELLDGACTAMNGCYFAAIGTPNSEYDTHPYLLAHVGPKWTSTSRRVYALDCAGSSFCAASVPGTGGYAVIRHTASGWHPARVPNPPGFQRSEFTAIDCPSMTCVAVGDTNGRTALVFDRLTSDRWRLQQSAPLFGDHGEFHDVSCATPNDCWAGGAITSSSDPLLFHYDGTSWEQDPGDPGSSHLESIDGLSCATTSFCLAVGDQGGDGVSTDQWDGVRWTAQDVTADFAPTDISCTSPTFCLAVGATPFNGGENGMVWDGSTWTTTTGPTLGSVSCVSSTYCLAVGRAPSSSDPDVVAVWNGSAFHTRSYPHPGHSWDFNGVSCVAVNVCTIAGSVYTPSVQTTVGFGETLSGSSWRVTTAPARGRFDRFDAVACSSSDVCRTVGSYYRDGVDNILVPMLGVLRG